MSLLLLTLLSLLRTEEEATTEHYHVISTYRNAAYVKSAAEALELAYPRTMKLLGLEPGESERYTVHLYSKNDEYLEKDKELNEGKFARNGAFSHPKTQESYILIQPRTGAPRMERMSALLLHEAFHLVSYRHAAWISAAPAWVSEGLAERAAEISMRREDATIETIKFADPILIIQRMHDRRDWIPLADLLSGNDSYNPDWMKRWLWYAEAWALVRFLSDERKEAWQRFLKEAQELKDSERGTARSRTILLKACDTSLRDLEEAWVVWIKKLKPAPWLRGDGDWKLTSDGVEGVAYPKSSAILISSERLHSDHFTLSAEVKVTDEGSGQADFLFSAAWDARFANLWKVSLCRSGFASVLVRKDGEWKRVASKKIDPKKVPSDRWLKLEVEVDHKKVRFSSDGELLVEHTFDDPDVELSDLRWGVGNYDSWTTFRAIRLKK